MDTKDEVKTKVERITTNTVQGEDLPRHIYNAIKKTLNIDLDEYLEVVWICGDTFDSRFDIVKDIIVGISNRRIFKIDKGVISHQPLKNIKSVTHQGNGMFRWDKVECLLTNGSKDTFGIWHKDVCKYFCTYITNKLSGSSIDKKRDTILSPDYDGDYDFPPIR